MKVITAKQTFHLNLKKQWFDMIFSGEKIEEYRDLSNYWGKRFESLFSMQDMYGNIYHTITESIIFSNGYSKDRRQFEIEFKGIDIGNGNEKWGANKDKDYYILKLGKVLQSNFNL